MKKMPEFELVVYQSGKPIKLASIWHQHNRGKNWLCKGTARTQLTINKGDWINLFLNDKSRVLSFKRVGTIEKIANDILDSATARIERVYDEEYVETKSRARQQALSDAKREAAIKVLADAGKIGCAICKVKEGVKHYEERFGSNASMDLCEECYNSKVEIDSMKETYVYDD